MPPDFAQRGAGSVQTCGIATDGRAYGWGRTNRGRLGVASAADGIDVPTRIALPTS